MSDKKYPYIGEAKITHTKVVFFSDGRGITIDGESYEIGHTRDNWSEPAFKNITTEYLANTYGEVKSKEHAEFIVKLAETANCAGLEVAKHKIASTENFRGIYFNFYTDNETLWFAFHHESQAKNRGEKQITIPSPPECNGVDEWPVVGSIVEWGHTGKGEVKSLSDGFAWVKLDNKDYTTVYVSSLRKPKTPEQELQEDLIDIFESSLDGGHFVDNLLSKYNITKKPQ